MIAAPLSRSETKAGADRLILFFTPEASVVPHLTAQCVLARTLKEQGENVAFAFCPSLFSRCPVMDMHGLPGAVSAAQRKQVCGECQHNAQAIVGAYGLPMISLADHVDHAAVLACVSLGQDMPADLRDFSYDGIAFGKICLHDLVLATKLNDHDNVSPENRALWIQYISSAVLSYLIIERLTESLNLRALVTYQDYGILLSARVAAAARGIPVFTTHAAWHRSVDRRHLVIVPEMEYRSRHDLSQRWPEWRDLPLAPYDVAEVAGDLLRKFGAGATHTYSPPKTFDDGDQLSSKLKLSPEKKLVVAYTSSTDEAKASKVLKDVFGIPTGGPLQPFGDQIEWISQLIAHFESRNDAQLVVRIHPREGANKRESIRSQHLEELHARFDGSYRNCLIIWPEEKVSSYDLAELASMALTSWSSMGLELARLGVPVLAAFKGYQFWPHESFLEWAPTASAYFEKLQQLLGRPAPFDNIKHAFRWYHMDALGRSVDLSDVIPHADFGGLPVFKLPAAAAAIRQIIVEGRNVVDINLERRRQLAGPGADAQEELALKSQLRRLVHVLGAGKEPDGEFELIFIGLNSEREVAPFVDRLKVTSLAPNIHLFIATPARNFYLFGGSDPLARRSPMAARLARAGAQFVWAEGNDHHRDGSLSASATLVSDLAALRSLLQDGSLAYPPP
ncbi:MAG TPA: hypothetical protein VH374_09725 [Polyangia bacterium]|jgi:hypothetical protein|nr:hypothetical protein [Polyangia bacterium]